VIIPKSDQIPPSELPPRCPGQQRARPRKSAFWRTPFKIDDPRILPKCASPGSARNQLVLLTGPRRSTARGGIEGVHPLFRRPPASLSPTPTSTHHGNVEFPPRSPFSVFPNHQSHGSRRLPGRSLEHQLVVDAAEASAFFTARSFFFFFREPGPSPALIISALCALEGRIGPANPPRRSCGRGIAAAHNRNGGRRPEQTHACRCGGPRRMVVVDEPAQARVSGSEIVVECNSSAFFSVDSNCLTNPKNKGVCPYTIPK